MKGKPQEITDELISLFEQQSGNRGVWESHWQEIKDRVYPSTQDFQTSFQTQGRKANEHIFDSTAATALSRFASILDSYLTPRNQTWHRILSSNDELNKDRAAKLYFDDVTRILFRYRYSTIANFASNNMMYNKSLGAFGTAVMFIDDAMTEPGMRYKTCHLGDCYPVENHQGIIDQMFRRFKMTARQIQKRWGDKTPPNVLEALKKNPMQEFTVLHYVGPNTDMDPGRIDYKGMPWCSHYILIEGKVMIDSGGFTSWPYITSRYEQNPSETYGRSPAMDVLPAIKTLNEQKKTYLKQGHRAVDPIILVADDGILDSFSLKPGAINAGGVSKEGRALVQTLPVGNIAASRDMMLDEQSIIKDNFLVTLFQILVETPTMTATEVMERTREKGILLAPTLGRQQSERFGPQIEREIDILSKQGLLPPMPLSVREAGGGFKVEYDSPLSKAQRAEEASGLMRTVESLINVANVTGDPAPLDHFDWDVITPDLSDINAVPTKWRKSMDEIKAIRQARAEQAQQQELVNAAPGIAAVTKAQKA